MIDLIFPGIDRNCPIPKSELLLLLLIMPLIFLMFGLSIAPSFFDFLFLPLNQIMVVVFFFFFYFKFKKIKLIYLSWKLIYTISTPPTKLYHKKKIISWPPPTTGSQTWILFFFQCLMNSSLIHTWIQTRNPTQVLFQEVIQINDLV